MTERKTVLLTGATGYIAKHIALKLLIAGYEVVGSVRSLARGDEVRAAVAPHVDATVDLAKNLRFVALNLGRDDGWDAAMAGVDILMHTASPFPLVQPKNEDDLIRPAVDGALRALRAAHAAKVRRVIFTSSAVAVMDSDLAPGQTAYDESNWSDVTRPDITPYAKSKTLAERAAWDYVRDEAPEIEMTSINPVVVIGAPLDIHFGTSVSIIQRVLGRKDPMLPNVGFPMVDVQDIAEMHVRAISTPQAEGKRLLGVHSFRWFIDISKTINANFPNNQVITRVAPNFVVRLLAIFDKSIRVILPILGKRTEVSNTNARDVLDMSFIPPETSITETATFLIEYNMLK